MGFLKQLFGTKENMDQKSDSLYSPMVGAVIPLEEVEDPVFAQGIVGQGVGIRPAEGRLFSPVSGMVASVFPTGHALGIKTDEGVEVLIHIGIDTVSLNGKGFHARVKQGEQVKAGELLIEFDRGEIERAKLKDTTMLLVTNLGEYKDIQKIKMGDAQVGDKLISLI